MPREGMKVINCHGNAERRHWTPPPRALTEIWRPVRIPAACRGMIFLHAKTCRFHDSTQSRGWERRRGRVSSFVGKEILCSWLIFLSFCCCLWTMEIVDVKCREKYIIGNEVISKSIGSEGCNLFVCWEERLGTSKNKFYFKWEEKLWTRKLWKSEILHFWGK